MKKWLLSLAVLFAGIANAQNYQCLQFGPKNYFTNGNGYLRGIRIDSVNVVGSDTIYHPYRTPRVSGYTEGTGIAPSCDTAGGSWLGKHVIQKTDGTWLFDNMWQDTVVIKTQAGIGDTWPFFNDVTNIHYTATVISTDTMTVLGSIDSIKTILITADTAGIPRLTDPVNNFTIKLSKDHGFVQVFDLFTFPYHLPDSLSDICYLDYYLDLVIGRNDGFGELIPTPIRGPLPDVNNSLFKLVALNNPTEKDIYNFVSGDVYEILYVEDHISTCTVIQKEYNDTVLTATHTSLQSDYIIADHYGGFGNYYCAPPAPSYFGASGTFGRSYDTTLLIDPEIMPEEKGAVNYYHYLPNAGPDTSFCNIRGRYVVNATNIYISGDTVLVSYSHGPDFGVKLLPKRSATYYPGYGLWSTSFVDANNSFVQDITYFYKNGNICYGAFRWATGINDINAPITEVQLIPNPANELLTVKTNITGAYTINITNILGQTAYSEHASNKEETIGISAFANGLYSVTITDEQGNRTAQKLVVAH